MRGKGRTAVTTKRDALAVRDKIRNVDKEPIHRYRLTRFRNGSKLDAIATEDNCSMEDVKKSIAMVQTHDAIFSVPALENAEVKMFLDVLELERKALEGALTATKKVFAEVSDPDTGEKTLELASEEPDYDTQLRCFEANTGRIASIMGKKDKGAPINLGIGVTVNNESSSSRDSFESRLRDTQARRAGGGTVIEATAVEGDGNESP